MRVKICGITNLKDALHAVECGADALGFVFYNKSPRYITPAAAKRIIDKLPPFVERIGLFVNEGVETIDTVCKYSDISRAQIHFDVDEESLDAIGLQTLPVVRVKDPEDLKKFKDRYRLVDVHSESYGGTGQRLNLEWFNGVDCSKIKSNPRRALDESNAQHAIAEAVTVRGAELEVIAEDINSLR
jgi:phosphoribosylanthranilate isomerase